MATCYFKNSVDQNWDTLGNWWANAACDEGFAGTLTGVTVTDTDTEVTCDSTAGLVVGRPITGDGIDTGTTVASITDGATFELSQAAISTETSDLTCELHVIPVTGDDVVIATGNGTVAGTPSADVLGLVTVNGDSVLNVTLAATNFEFNGTSSTNNAASNLTGICTFNDSSINNGAITGSTTFNGSSNNQWIITGAVAFNDTGFSSYGTVIGNVDFNDTSYANSFPLDVTGNVSFNDSSYNNSTTVTVTGIVSFNDTSYNNATVTANFVFNDSSYNSNNGYITGNPTFNGTSYADLFGAITGTATFKDSSYNGGATISDAIIRQHAAAFVAWRDYAASSCITGTLTLQFPEMDVLGTGLL